MPTIFTPTTARLRSGIILYERVRQESLLYLRYYLDSVALAKALTELYVSPLVPFISLTTRCITLFRVRHNVLLNTRFSSKH